jgi:hypothetical protein
MSEEMNEQVDPGKEAMVAEIDRLRAELEKAQAAAPSDHELVTAETAQAARLVTVEQLRELHGQELFGILTGPNTGAGTLR